MSQAALGLGPLELILASASPRRTELLKEAGIPHRVVVADVIEHEDARSDPRALVLHNACLKAQAVAALHPQALVLGADTTVALGDRVLNKPANLAEAKAMLRSLSGQVHTVHTAICLVIKAEHFAESHALTARVQFRTLTEAVIEEYTQLVNTLDKAGAYGIQQGKALIIASHDEPLSLIMGLPVEFTCERLEQLGFRARLID